MTNPSPKRLEHAVKEAASREHIAERRLRRWIAATALVDALSISHRAGNLPPFLIKGGFALELRFRALARSSRDVDIVLPLPKEELVDTLVVALRAEWSGFSFRLKSPPEDRGHAHRLLISTSYLTREWATFELDLVHGSVDDREPIEPYDLTVFGLSAPSSIPCLSVSEQIAQKLHAVTHAAEDRARDLVDIYLLDTQLDHDDTALMAAVNRVFGERSEHVWPPEIVLRPGWRETLGEIITRNVLALNVDEVVDGVQSLVQRLARLGHLASTKQDS
jgi:hypothetical protein